jgi:UDP-N-acetylglucosamine diphosphorylase/glucosamine-1-phosphate N-acetyltransferase
MNVILNDHPTIWQQLRPLTCTRTISDIRCGILTIREKWERIYNQKASSNTQNHLSEKYDTLILDDNLIITSHYLPDNHFISALASLQHNSRLRSGNDVLAYRLNSELTYKLFELKELEAVTDIEYHDMPLAITNPWHIFQHNGREIENDFHLLTQNRTSHPICNSNRVLHPENVFVEEGVQMEFTTINATSAKVYIGKHAVVMENTSIRGSIAICEGAEIKMAAKIYGPTTIGPYSKVGGEINNSVIFGYSNKAHDGFLGNSVLGEWCNLGADTNNSNLKNDYSMVKLWSYPENRFINTGLQFCGLIMGDHSKSGINTMFNTGTSVGVSCNIFGDGFPRNYVPSFSWGGASGFTEYNFDKAIKVAQQVMLRRKLTLSNADITILRALFNEAHKNHNP